MEFRRDISSQVIIPKIHSKQINLFIFTTLVFQERFRFNKIPLSVSGSHIRKTKTFRYD